MAWLGSGLGAAAAAACAVHTSAGSPFAACTIRSTGADAGLAAVGPAARNAVDGGRRGSDVCNGQHEAEND